MSITVGKSAKIIARLESSGEPVTANITMIETTGLGSLLWADRVTGTVLVEQEKTEVINDIVGQSQCVLSVTPNSIVSINLIDSDGFPTGSNLTALTSLNGRTIDLNTQLATGTELLASYYKGGSVKNELTGLRVGTARVIVSANVSLEKGLSQTVEIQIVAKTVPANDDGGSGGNDNYETFELNGPGAISWFRSGYYFPPGVINSGGGFNQSGGAGGIPYFLLEKNKWYLLRKWMFNGTGSPTGHDVTGCITSMVITGSVLMVANGNSCYAVGDPGPGGTTLTVTTDYQYGGKIGTVTKSVALGVG